MAFLTRKRLATLTTVICVLLTAVIVGLSVLHGASRHVPEFYARAIQADRGAQRDASAVMLRKTAALVSDVGNEEQWKSLFTSDEINGWLAVDLVENHPHALPSTIADPRVQIEPNRSDQESQDITVDVREDVGDEECPEHEVGIPSVSVRRVGFRALHPFHSSDSDSRKSLNVRFRDRPRECTANVRSGRHR